MERKYLKIFSMVEEKAMSKKKMRDVPTTKSIIIRILISCVGIAGILLYCSFFEKQSVVEILTALKITAVIFIVLCLFVVFWAINKKRKH